MKMLRGFLLGAVLVAAGGAIAGPSILAAIPMPSCTAISGAPATLGGTSETVFAADDTRKAFCVVNNDSAIAVHLKYGATATTGDTKIGPGGSFCEEIAGGYVYTGVVDMIAASGTPTISGFSCK